MYNLFIDIFIILFLILLNGFFTGSEIAIISIKQVNLNELSKKSKKGKLLSDLKKDPDRFFATIQIAITLLSTLTSVYGGSRLIQYLNPYLMSLDLKINPKYIEEIALIILVFILSYVTLIFGELIPKSLGVKYANRYALAVAYPLYFFSKIFSSFTYILTFSSNFILGLMRKGQHTSFSESHLHEEEIKEILKEGVSIGAIEHNEQEIISNIFKINDTSAREVMTPRVNLLAISLESPISEIEETIFNSSHSRLPVYKDNPDNILGILYVKDFYRAHINNQIPDIEELIKPVFHVPESMKIDKILKEMQKKKTHLAIVVDEYGGTSGIITMENIFEEIVGDIQDVNEEHEEESIVKLPTGSFLISGLCSIAEFNEYFNESKIPESEGYNSIAGFIIEALSRFPEVGEIISYENFDFELLRRVNQKLVQFRFSIRK